MDIAVLADGRPEILEAFIAAQPILESDTAGAISSRGDVIANLAVHAILRLPVKIA